MFLPNGLLSLGEHPISFSDLKKLIKKGPDNGQQWDFKWRLRLLNEFEKRYLQLQSAGITEVYIDGSFATDKPRPNDIDAYFIVPRALWLSHAEPFLEKTDSDFWNFNMEEHDGKVAYGMSFKHNIELFPIYREHTPEYAADSDLIDPKLNFFRTDKYSRQPKGIFKIIHGGGFND